jgi:hypothetical protein
MHVGADGRMLSSYTQAGGFAVQVYFQVLIHKNSSAKCRHRHRKTVHSVPLTCDLLRSSFFFAVSSALFIIAKQVGISMPAYPFFYFF